MDRDERTNVLLFVSVSEVDEVLEEYFLSGLKKKIKRVDLIVKPHQVFDYELSCSVSNNLKNITNI